ncbi:MAG: hypothetical protein H7841_03260 [Magnetospirillum sp. WYHS-4]
MAVNVGLRKAVERGPANHYSLTMAKGGGGESQVVWTGKIRPAEPDRAEIYQPTQGGKFAFQGHGGKGGKDEPKPVPVPTPKPAAKPAQSLSPAAQSRAIAETVVSSLLDRLVSEAKRKGGMLSVDDIQGLTQEFEKKTAVLQTVFEKSFEDYVKARERAAWQQTRQYPFDRVIVQTFAGSFADGPKLINDPDALSRRILPGFFMALGMMLGPEAMDQCQERCRKIVARHKSGRNDEFDWQNVYDDPETKALVLEAQVAIAPYFEDLRKRADWLINLVNTHLSPYEGDANSPVARWTMTEVSFFTLVEGLLGGLKATLNTDAGAQELAQRHGHETCSRLYKLFRKLDAAATEFRSQAVL